MLTFYFAPGSSSMAPHIALHETGASFEGKPLSLAKKDTRTPAFLAMNPAGKVPVLMVDDRMLTEVAGILFYLARTFPAAGLLPQGDVEAEALALDTNAPGKPEGLRGGAPTGDGRHRHRSRHADAPVRSHRSRNRTSAPTDTASRIRLSATASEGSPSSPT